MNIIDAAVRFAVDAHEGGKRKGSDLPYILHPMEAAAIAAQITRDPEVIAAALLHDVVEDTPCTADELRARFGDRVTALVLSDTEDKRVGRPAEETWEERKQETIDYLRTAPRDAKIIAFADKLSNLRSITNDYLSDGEALWNRFKMKDPNKHLWYYTETFRSFEEFSDTILYGEYERLLELLGTRIRNAKKD